MLDEAANKDLVIFLLPKNFILYLLKLDWFAKLSSKLPIIIVTSKKLEAHLADYSNVVILERKGVARIGAKNRHTILEIVNSLSDPRNSHENIA